ncbi:hypothetical protein KGF42_00370 [Clostridioides sp. ZZV15-6383]|uniref:hypothetical protein n=1 Tax=unclassified Clostridioides TaxID=2635829 RepID=UPI001D0FE973|nr:hypothetical protein [Clostridioides sp. ZZV14-6345]MCC0697920.1 hypothetical protein [Clostridioides sp. ZZV15-6383]
MSNYILTLQLKTEKFQEDIIYNTFNKYRKVYNSCLSELFKRYNHMIESKEHQANCKYKGKDRSRIFNDINKKYNLTEYSLHNLVIIKNNDNYAQRAIQDKIKYCRIFKK